MKIAKNRVMAIPSVKKGWYYCQRTSHTKTSGKLNRTAGHARLGMREAIARLKPKFSRVPECCFIHTEKLTHPRMNLAPGLRLPLVDDKGDT